MHDNMDPSWVFAPAPIAGVPVRGDERKVPVRRIFCVGRNYAAHAREMGADPEREPPFFFAKPADAVVTADEVPWPGLTDDLQHEVELVAAIGTGGRDIDPATALSHVFGYAVGVDLTRRDLQAEAKRLGRPWDVAKGFDFSAPVGAVVSASDCGHPVRGAISLAVNGDTRQDGDLADMIWPVADVIARLSRFFELQPGDLVFTGTPDGVGRLRPGDRVVARVEGVGELAFRMADC